MKEDGHNTCLGIQLSKCDYERKCLSDCLRFANEKGHFTREALYALSGDYLRRPDGEERPDIIVRSPKDSISEGRYIGIEHLSVHQFSEEEKKGKINSTGKRLEAQLQHIYDDGHEEYLSTGSISDKNAEKLVSAAIEIAEIKYQYGYKSFLKSFQYSLRNHIDNSSIYCENLNQYNNGNSDLAFLIELNIVLPPIFINDGRLIYPYSGSGLIFTPDIVDLLAEIPAEHVDFIVLCTRTPITGEITDVVAIKTGEILSALKKEGAICCPYCGEDILEDNFFIRNQDTPIRHGIVQGKEGYSATVKYQLNPKKEFHLHFNNALTTACDYYQKGEVFAASWGIQRALFSFEEYLPMYSIKSLLSNHVPINIINSQNNRLQFFDVLFHELRKKAPPQYRE